MRTNQIGMFRVPVPRSGHTVSRGALRSSGEVRRATRLKIQKRRRHQIAMVGGKASKAKLREDAEEKAY